MGCMNHIERKKSNKSSFSFICDIFSIVDLTFLVFHFCHFVILNPTPNRPQTPPKLKFYSCYFTIHHARDVSEVPTTKSQVNFSSHHCRNLLHRSYSSRYLLPAVTPTPLSAHSLGNFGVGTNIQEILLTSKHRSRDRLHNNRPPHTNPTVNQISWIVVCTPKLP